MNRKPTTRKRENPHPSGRGGSQEYGRVYVWDEKNGWRVKNSKRRLMKVSNALKTASPTE